MGNSTNKATNPPNINVNDRDQQKIIALRHKAWLQRVEAFAKSIYIAGSKKDGMKLIMGSKLARNALKLYLDTVEMSYYIEAFDDINLLVKSSSSESIIEKSLFCIKRYIIDHEQLKFSEKLIQKAKVSLGISMKSNSSKSDTTAGKQIEKDKSFTDEETSRTAPSIDEASFASEATLLQILNEMSTEIVFQLAENVYSNFIRSANYNTWRAAESSHAAAYRVDDARKLKVQDTIIKSAQLGSGNLKSSFSAMGDMSTRIVTRRFV
jgi:hypothetical protein